MIDAVVVGAGPNGLVAANVLADRGWSVLVCEAAAEPGGAVRSAEVTAPGFTSDLFSAFYPLAAVSPILRTLELERWGLRWTCAPNALANPLPDGRVAAITSSTTGTARLLGRLQHGDDANWLAFMERWQRLGPRFVAALLAPFPPIRSGIALLTAAPPREIGWLARAAVTPVRRMGEEEFIGAGPRLLLAGSALHTDLTPEAAGSGIFGWLLLGLAQQVGFPVPVGGAAALTDALVRRLRDRGGEVRCDARVTKVCIARGEAVGVEVDGEEIAARRAVLVTSLAPTLYREMLLPTSVPEHVQDGMRRWQPSAATVKVDWALRAPIPWADVELQRAGTVHLADSMNDLSRFACDLATDSVPSKPFVIVGQMTTADANRSPHGTESAWAYTHVPHHPGDGNGSGAWTRERVKKVVETIEVCVERYAPGFHASTSGRFVQGPCELEAANSNLRGGDISAGTSQLHQQLVFRPKLGLGRAETAIPRLYLAGASAHPGGGVHGAPGANAARAALAHDKWRDVKRWVTRG